MYDNVGVVIHGPPADEYNKVCSRLSAGQIALNGILERVPPQWHLIENAEALHANPLLPHEVHWHYFQLCAERWEQRLLDRGLLTPDTVATVHALEREEFRWLANIPISALVELRKNNENEEFRHRLQGYVGQLHSATLDDIDRVAADVAHGLIFLNQEHERKVDEIRRKYARRHGFTAVSGRLTATAAFIPALAPFIPAVTPLALAGAYLKDKVQETQELRKLSRPLIGVLAAQSKRSA